MSDRTHVWYAKAKGGENYLTYTVTSVVSVKYKVSVTSVVSVTFVVTGDRRRGDRGENYVTYHVQATERTIRAYGTQMHRMEKTI